jgi:hypothetical protein
MLAFVAALLLTAITVSSACVASPSLPLQFTIQTRSSTDVHVRFERQRNGRSESNWETSFRPAELVGLDVAALNTPGTRPLRFSIVREAGRVDCAGSGGNEMARGSCSMTASQDFLRFLSDHGIKAPRTEEDTLSLIALDVHRDLVTALARARYPTPSIDKLVELTAVEVTPAYIDELSRQGYRPPSLDGLVQFAALKITPEYIGSFARAGYGNLPPDDLVELKALDITPEYIAGFERIGYGHLPVDTLVQLKALDITPEFVRAVQQGDSLPSPDHLVQLRAVTQDMAKKH